MGNRARHGRDGDRPEQVASGHGSPGAALTGFLAALSSKNPATSCGYIFLGSARCRVQTGQGSRDQLPYGVSVKIGYVAVGGTRALIGFTGKICWTGATPEYMANTNPASLFSAGNTFAALWTQTVNPNSSDTFSYRLLPCVEVGGQWYVVVIPVSVVRADDPEHVRRDGQPAGDMGQGAAIGDAAATSAPAADGRAGT
jgi:hypothetical protein